MTQLTKFLTDDHARIRRALDRYRRTRTQDAAGNVADHVRLHSMIEAEFLQPFVLSALSPREAEMEAAAHDRLDQVVEALDRSYSDAEVHQLMGDLERLMSEHAAAEERTLWPRLSASEHQQELGRLAAAKWQELFSRQSPRQWVPMSGLANTGWGGGGRLPNSGW